MDWVTLDRFLMSTGWRRSGQVPFGVGRLHLADGQDTRLEQAVITLARYHGHHTIQEVAETYRALVASAAVDHSLHSSLAGASRAAI